MRALRPVTKYAKRGDAHVAYQVVGDGPVDLVVVSTWFSHLEARWEIPGFAYYLERLSSFARVISFDKFGIGLSDPVPARVFPPLEEWVEDVSAVLDAAEIERASVLGANEGAFMAILFAASHPDRTEALALANATPRLAWAADYEIGIQPDVQQALVGLLERTWGTGAGVAALNPSIADDEGTLELWGHFLRLSASPSTAALVTKTLFELDLRPVLKAVQAPTLVVHRRDVALPPVTHGRYVAEGIPGATFIDVPGVDYGLAIGDIDAVLDPVEEFLTGARAGRTANRVLATLLFTDIVESTGHVVRLGDRQWSGLLEAHDDTVRRLLPRYGGQLVDTAGDGLLATFDGPARAIACALALRESLRRIGLTIRAGVHTGEIEPRGEGVAGVAVTIGARVQALAQPGEILVSRTVKDLVAGADLSFDDRGDHVLKGVPEAWQLYAVHE
jgi:class 3 adenylate cyclase/pimeloyl-ACP methyl ester carboxylesterase